VCTEDNSACDDRNCAIDAWGCAANNDDGLV
jgi:hypothetical protein